MSQSGSQGRGRGGRVRGRGGRRGGGLGSESGAPSSRQNGSRSVQRSIDNNGEMNSDLPERFRKGRGGRYQHNRDDWSPTQQSNLDVKLNVHIRKYMQDQNSLKASNRKESWIDALEIPRPKEIHLADGTTVDLSPNKIDGKFKSVARYLKTHYTLLREDAIGPLRDAIDKFSRQPDMTDDPDLSIYEKVHVSGFTFTNMGIATRLRFSTRRAGRKILWSASKRLVSGSLVALTPADDNFGSKCIVATVAARPLELLERCPHEVDVYFSSPDDIQIDPQIPYVMIESKQGYFEAYRHTLKAIQKLSMESFSFAPNITGLDLNICPPRYLADSPHRSLSAVFNSAEEAPQGFNHVDLVDDWPSAPDGTTLDESQWDALKQILTRRLAIIQGPPGTGKTHVSKVALKIMVQNRKQDDPPIIVAAQTNHALDQLLMHVSEFDPEFIRLGGRSTKVEIKRRALYEVRQREVIPNIAGSLFGPAKKKLEREYARFGELLSIFTENTQVISCEKLLQSGVIDAAQHKSLTDAAENWITTNENEKNPMHYWLHKALVPFEVNYDDDNFGFDDAEDDLEIEQLKETEAEHGVADEEDIEMLRGPWRSVSDNWTVALPSESELELAKRMLDTKKNLWDIPEHLRGAVYLVMKQKIKEVTLTKFRQYAYDYGKIVEELKIGKWEKDAVFLKRANVIGLTTTGLSKYRPLISSLQPKIILIEEAAEVLEGPVTAACMESVEHLILIGDHKQLQGHCSLQELEGAPFHLNVSMFERLVNVSIPYKTLSRQRRMNPEIRELVSSLYPELDDHESVHSRQQLPPWGTGSVRSFFFHHEWTELKDESLSTYNEEEGRMVAKFYRHLIRNGVPATFITILTFYNGQRKKILRELKKDPETNTVYNNVKTVDSYQGEENHIVLLSLVRNNTQGQIGFLQIDNRVCVALSRAKHGFYLFGNGYLLSEKSELWSSVGALMSDPRSLRFGTELPLTCTNHNRTTTVDWPDDFDKNDGGCDLWCGADLPCGHTCPRKCHPKPHEQIPCQEQCNIVLQCDHKCTKKCFEYCWCDCDTYLTLTRNVERFADDEEDRQKHDLASHSTTLTLDPSTDGNNDAYNSHGPQSNSGARGDVASRNYSRALARGGAAFQPLSPIRIDGGGGSRRHHDAVQHLSPQSERNKNIDWTEFANGGAAEDDKNRESAQTLLWKTENLNLIDLSPTETKASGVEHIAEQSKGQDRTVYTQTYRPSAPDWHMPSTSEQEGSTQAPNLMDW